MIIPPMQPVRRPRIDLGQDFTKLEQRVLAQGAQSPNEMRAAAHGTVTGRFVEAPPSRPMLHPIWPVLLFVAIFLATGALGFALGQLRAMQHAASGCQGAPEAAPAPSGHATRALPAYRPSGRHLEARREP